MMNQIYGCNLKMKHFFFSFFYDSSPYEVTGVRVVDLSPVRKKINHVIVVGFFVFFCSGSVPEGNNKENKCTKKHIPLLFKKIVHYTFQNPTDILTKGY